MTIVALVPFIVGIVGALVYVFAGNAKIAEIGRLMFLAAVIALMFAFGGAHVRIGG